MNNLIEEKGVNDSKVKYLSEVLDRLLVLKLKGSSWHKFGRILFYVINLSKYFTCF